MPIRQSESWFHRDDVAKTFAAFYEVDLEWAQLATGDGPRRLPCFSHEFGGFRSLVPGYGYAGTQIEPGQDLSAVIDGFAATGAAAAFAALQGTNALDDPRYAAKMPSYILDLAQEEAALRSKVSRRRRSKLAPKPADPISFCYDDKDRLIPHFVEFYGASMARLGAGGRFVFDPATLKRLCALSSTRMIGVLKNDQVEMVMLHGVQGSAAEFILSGSSDEGRPLATFALWASALWLQGLGMSSFHLGGGMQPGDGLDDFKRQFGGQVLANGGLKLVLAPDIYAELCAKVGAGTSLAGFFPPYLRAAVLGT